MRLALLLDYFATYPPDPLPLLREGGIWIRERLRPSLKLLPLLSFIEKNIKGESKRDEASLIIPSPPPL